MEHPRDSPAGCGTPAPAPLGGPCRAAPLSPERTLAHPPVAVARLRPACAARPLVSRGLGDPGDAEGGHAGDAVVVPCLHLPAVHHILDAWDGEGRLGHVGGHDAQANPLRGRLEDLGGRGGSKAAPE